MTREPLALPGLSDGSISAWGGASRNRLDPSCEKALEHTHDGILATRDDGGNLGRGLTQGFEQEHLIADAGFSIEGVIVALAQLCKRLLVQGRQGDGRGQFFFLRSSTFLTPILSHLRKHYLGSI